MFASISSSRRNRGMRASTLRRSAARSGMAPNILMAMPSEPPQRTVDVELLELRVLDGPNRFFTRPAVKLEFGAREPGAAHETAQAAADAARRIFDGLTLTVPSFTFRDSVDGRRSMVAYP